MEKRLIYYHAQTPIHVGAETNLGIIDVPIQREKHTNFPKIEASGIKGTFRDLFEKGIKEVKENSIIINLLFGPEDNGNTHAGNLRFTDAKILLFPVKSAKGIFAWITCPLVLERFQKECNLFGITRNEKKAEVNTAINNDKNIGIEIKKKDNKSKKRIILEEYSLEVKDREIYENILDIICSEISKEADNYIKEKLSKDIFVVSDEEFQHFVEMSTEINTRIRIGKKGVVEEGALFTEEDLPVETIMYGFVLVDQVYMEIDKKEEVEKELKKVSQEYQENQENNNGKRIIKIFSKNIKNISYIQLGGNMTLGKGITKVILGGE